MQNRSEIPGSAVAIEGDGYCCTCQALLVSHAMGIVKSVKILSKIFGFHKSQPNNPNIILLWKHRSEKQDKGTFQIIGF